MVRPPFWVGQRLIALAVARWPEFHGTVLLRTGREPLDLPWPSLLDMINAWWVDGATEQDAAAFHRTLYLPPPGVDLDDRGEWSDDETDGTFARALGHPVDGT